MSAATIKIEGAVHQPKSFTRDELGTLPADGRMADVSTVAPNRQGEAVRLECLLSESEPDDTATHVTLHSVDGFSASIPLADIRESQCGRMPNCGPRCLRECKTLSTD